VPIYEYTCLACEREFEKLVQGAAAVACPACGTERVMRRLSLFRARTTVSAGPASGASAAPMGGGCCGGGCGCH
jgi:putative FmdB family regulatory protein